MGYQNNTNARWISEELAALGVSHYRQNVIGDNLIRLKEIISEISNRSSILITTGGLGPTPDDITTETIASTFEAELIESSIIIQDIKSKFNDNLKLHKNNFKQAKNSDLDLFDFSPNSSVSLE